MIVIISPPQNMAYYNKLNSVNRYHFHFTKGANSFEIREEIDKLQSIDCFVIEYQVIDKEEIGFLLEWLADQAPVLVVAKGLSPYDTVTQDFYNLGVTNVVTTTDETQLIQDFLAYISNYVLEDTILSAPIQSELPFINKNLPQTILQPLVKETNSTLPITIAGNSRTITIAFAGAGKRIGTTTQTFQTAYYLNSLRKSVAILDMQEIPWLLQIDIENSEGIEQISQDKFTVYGVDFYTNQRLLPTLKTHYEYLLIDYGDFSSLTDVTSFIEKDKHILVCGYNPWEESELMAALEYDSGQTNYLFSFVSEQLQPRIYGSMDDLSARTYFAAFSPNPAKYCGVDILYQTLTGAKSFSKQEQTIPKEKKKWFAFKKKIGG